MRELPPFLRRYARPCRALPRGGSEVSGAIERLYEEFWAMSGTDGWLLSPRGKWVAYQLDWFEAHAGWRAEQ